MDRPLLPTLLVLLLIIVQTTRSNLPLHQHSGRHFFLVFNVINMAQICSGLKKILSVFFSQIGSLDWQHANYNHIGLTACQLQPYQFSQKLVVFLICINTSFLENKSSNIWMHLNLLKVALYLWHLKQFLTKTTTTE